MATLHDVALDIDPSGRTSIYEMQDGTYRFRSSNGRFGKEGTLDKAFVLLMLGKLEMQSGLGVLKDELIQAQDRGAAEGVDEEPT